MISMKLIVGLGNPGKEYENTRHNMGFMFIDECVKSLGVDFTKEKFGGKYTEKIINDEKVIFLKPQKYINLSGDVIREYMHFFKIDIDDLFVIHDDMHTEVGKFKIRYKGSSGGHNGLKNIEQNLKTNEYKRLKIGISSNNGTDMKDYVLSKMSNDDMQKIKEIISLAPAIINDYMMLTFANLMNKYN